MPSRRISLIYLWFLLLMVVGPACRLTPNLVGSEEPTPTRPRRYVVLPPVPATPVPGLAELSLPEQTTPTTPNPTRRSRPTATPTQDNFARLFAEVLNMFNQPTATPTNALRLVKLPTLLPTPTSTAIPLPTDTPWPTDTPMPTATFIAAPVDIPTPLPTDTPLAEIASAPIEEPPPVVDESIFTSPVAFSPPVVEAPPPAVVDASTFSSPLAAPSSDPAKSVAAPAEAGPDFMLGEFYNSPTTNSFIVIYVAIVDANEIPIGDMKVVGTRLDHNLTYESPLSTWYFEGYNAPGEVIKSGNVKFEPPGGIETTHWILHLEDANGVRMSDDVPFDTKQDDKQWYFIKFKRKF